MAEVTQNFPMINPRRSHVKSSHDRIMAFFLLLYINTCRTNDAKNVKISAHNPNDPVSEFQGVPRNMAMISVRMKEADYIYATHQVGKWHIGFATPKGRGFDTSLNFGYFNAANDYYTKTIYSCNNTPMKDLWDTDRWTSFRHE